MILLSSNFRSDRDRYRKSFPSSQRRSNAMKRGSPLRNSKSRNCGLPSVSKQTISPSRIVVCAPSSPAIASLTDEKDLSSFPLREISLHFPCSIRTTERKPSHLISNSQSRWENGLRARLSASGWKDGSTVPLL